MHARDGRGSITRGFLLELATLLESSSFDAGRGQDCFAVMLASGSRLGTSLQTNWASLQAGIMLEPHGVLWSSAARASAESSNLQRDITTQRERRAFQALDVQVHALPSADMHRRTCLDSGSFSTALMICWPCPNAYLADEQFADVVACYVDLPSCCVKPSLALPSLGSTRATGSE